MRGFSRCRGCGMGSLRSSSSRDFLPNLASASPEPQNSARRKQPQTGGATKIIDLRVENPKVTWATRTAGAGRALGVAPGGLGIERHGKQAGIVGVALVVQVAHRRAQIGVTHPRLDLA